MSITPDGLRYLEAHHEPQHLPYHYRWLVPAIARGHRERFTAITYASLAAMVPLGRAYTGSWAAGLYGIGLSGVGAFNVRYPVLVDAPAQAAALACAVAVKRRRWTLATLLALIAGSTKESAPVFAALYARHPLPLVGLISPAVRYRSAKPLGPEPDWEPFHIWVLRHPRMAAKLVRRDTPQTWREWVAPWGVLAVGFLHPSPQVVATTAVAYGQCAAATDTVRLYQWAWPVLADRTVRSFGRWAFLGLLAHWWNPMKGQGG